MSHIRQTHRYYALTVKKNTEKISSVAFVIYLCAVNLIDAKKQVFIITKLKK